MRRLPKLSFTLILFLTLGVTVVNAQSKKQLKKNKKQAEKLVKEADAEFDHQMYPQALELYLEANKLYSEDAHTNLHIGLCYEKYKDKGRAVEYIRKAYELNPEVHEDILYYLAEGYHYHEDFDDAIEHYKKYIATLNSKKDAYKIKLADRGIYECNNAKEFVANPVDVKIKRLGSAINSKWNDYSPVISADEEIMVFTSRREGTTGGGQDHTGIWYEDVYISKKVNGQFQPAQNLSTVNTDVHEASVSLSPDGKKLILYKGDVGGGDLFLCKQKEDGEWVKPKPFPKSISAKKSYEPSGTISNDGNTLYFVSNRDGGFGGLDIYKATKNKKGKWDDPVNLGPTINTEEDEDAPFLDLDGKTLYFSSESHKGMGEYDIFKSVYDEASDTWSEPENLGYPINSVESDIYFVLSGDGRHAYFSSVKEGGMGGEDIYIFEMPKSEDYADRIAMVEEITGHHVEEEPEPEPEPEPIPEPEPEPEPDPIVVELMEVQLIVKIFDATTNEPLEATIQLVDAETKEEFVNTTALDGIFEAEFKEDKPVVYSIYAQREGYGYKSINVTIPAMSDVPQRIEKLIYLKPIEQEIEVIHVLRNIYFDFDKFTLKPESYNELEKLEKMLKDNPNLKVELAGHTDFIGPDGYNDVLSRKRAKAVVNYLQSKGISPSRMTYKGYGETKPMASNDDESEGRELNRRTEFILLED